MNVVYHDITVDNYNRGNTDLKYASRGTFSHLKSLLGGGGNALRFAEYWTYK